MNSWLTNSPTKSGVETPGSTNAASAATRPSSSPTAMTTFTAGPASATATSRMGLSGIPSSDAMPPKG